ncbi:MAG: oligosaccharide flippase family protein [Lachnospiraceae bacterium]
MLKLLPKSIYARNVMTLITGAGMAQAIPIAISPILTRIYSPENFGLFAFYMSIASVLVVFATGRYELAIVLPKRDRDAMHIVVLSIALSCLVSIFLFIIILIFNSQITQLTRNSEISPWLYWIPVSTLFMGIYQSLIYWCNRQAKYKRLAISRTVQGSSTGLLQLGVGVIAGGAAGLVAGDVGGRALSSTILAKSVYIENREIIFRVKKIKILAIAKKYIDFPKYLIFAHSINTISFQLPIILLGTLFNSAVPGLYMLMQRIMSAPLSLIAGAVGDVFRQEASAAYIHKGNCKEIFEKTFKKLFVISFLPFLVFFFIAPDLFEFIFGLEWRAAGEYAKILTPMFFMQFITNPLSAMFLIAEKQRVDLVWQIALFFAVFLSLYVGHLYFDINGTLISFSFSYSVMYFICGILSYRMSCGEGVL